jgi:hypothetical protein
VCVKLICVKMLLICISGKSTLITRIDIDLGCMFQPAMLEDMVRQTGYKSSLLEVIFLGRSWCKWGRYRCDCYAFPAGRRGRFLQPCGFFSISATLFAGEAADHDYYDINHAKHLSSL